MKTIFRILAILLAITVVAGATYAIGQSGLVSQQTSLRGEEGRHLGRGQGEFGHFDEDVDQGERPNFGSESGDRDRDRQSLGFDAFALSSFARILLPMALVITAVVLLSMAGQWWRNRSKNRPSPPDTPAPTS